MIKIHKGENLQENNFRGVYLIRNLDNRLLKIGRCNNLARRFKEIVRSFNFCGVEPKLKVECFLEYDNEIDLELYLHEQFKEVREQNEWFEIEDIHIILEKLDSFEEIEKLKEKKKNNKVVVRQKNKIEKVKKLPKESNEYRYFKFLNFRHNLKGEVVKIEKIIWRTKILDISILEKKVSDAMNTYCDIRDFTVFYDYNLIKQEIQLDKSISQKFKELNTDCIVEVYEVNRWEEVEDEYGDIEVIECEEEIFKGTLDFYTYLYNYEIDILCKSIIYYQNQIGISCIFSLETEKLICEMFEDNILEHLRKECMKYYKMYLVCKNPDIEYFD